MPSSPYDPAVCSLSLRRAKENPLAHYEMFSHTKRYLDQWTSSSS